MQLQTTLTQTPGIEHPILAAMEVIHRMVREAVVCFAPRLRR